MNLSVSNIIRILKTGLSAKAFPEKLVIPTSVNTQLMIKQFPDLIEKLLELKAWEIISHLNNVSPLTVSRDKNLHNGKEYFQLIFHDKATSYVLSRLLIDELKETFDIIIHDRNVILRNLSSAFNNQKPKIVIRSDIKSFFEGVCHKRLFEIMESNENITQLSLDFYKKIFIEFERHRHTTEKIGYGLPRGLAVSSYLAEVFLKQVDLRISSRNEVCFYSRYVDDIILLIKNHADKDANKYFCNVSKIFNEIGLELHEKGDGKSSTVCIASAVTPIGEYLGYTLEWDSETSKLIFKLPSHKIDKKKQMIDNAFLNFEIQSKKSIKQAKRDLMGCLNMISANYQLSGTKRYIRTGIYYSNRLLNDYSSLNTLTEYLQSKTLEPYKRAFSSERDMINYISRLKRLVNKIDFHKNWETRKMVSLTPQRISRLKAIINTEHT